MMLFLRVLFFFFLWGCGVNFILDPLFQEKKNLVSNPLFLEKCKSKEDEVYCDFFYHPNRITNRYGNIGYSVKPNLENFSEHSILYQIDGEKVGEIKVDSDNGIISWSDQIDPGSYSFKIKAHGNNPLKSEENQEFHSMSSFYLVIDPDSLTNFSYSQSNVQVPYADSGISVLPKKNKGATSLLSYQLSNQTGDPLPGGVNISNNGQIIWKNLTNIGTNDLMVIVSDQKRSLRQHYRLVVEKRNLAEIDFSLGSTNLEAVYGDLIAIDLITTENLRTGMNFSNLFEFSLISTDQDEIPEIIFNSEEKINLKSDLTVKQNRTYLLRIKGKEFYQGARDLVFNLKITPKILTDFSDLSYGGPQIITQGVGVSRTLNLPDGFLLGDDSWSDAVDFSITRSDGEPVSDSVTVGQLGRVDIADSVVVSDGGDYWVRMEGKGNYQGSSDIALTITPKIQIDFSDLSYGGPQIITQGVGVSRTLNLPDGFLLEGNSRLDAVDFSITRSDGEPVSDSVTVGQLGRVDISDSVVVSDGGDYRVRLEGKGNYQGSSDIALTITPKIQIDFSGLSYGGPQIITQGVGVSRTLNLPDGFLLGGNSWSEVVDFSITRSDGDPAPDSVTVGQLGRVDISDSVAVSDGGDYQVRLEGKGNYQGSSDIALTITPKIQIDFSGLSYGGPQIITQGVEVSRTLNLPDGFLLGGDSWSDAVDFSITRSDGDPAPDSVTVDQLGRVDIADSVVVSDGGDYRVRMEGKGNYQGSSAIALTITPKIQIDFSDLSYGGPVIPEGVTVSRTLNLPDGFLLEGDKWSDAVDFSITRSDGDPAPDSVRVEQLGRVDIADSVVVNDGGDYRVRLEGKGNYQGSSDIEIEIRIDREFILISEVEIDFYGDGHQMGWGDLLWKGGGITIKVPNMDHFKVYQLILRDEDEEEVRSLSLKTRGEEGLSLKFAYFNEDNWGKLVSLKEGEIEVDLVERLSGRRERSVIPSGIEIRFTKALGEIRNWRDLQAIGFNSALGGDYTLMNNIVLPSPGNDGGLAGIDQNGNLHTMPVEGFDPIGDKDNPFRGTLNGNGYRIKGLSIKRPDKNYLGLFGMILGSGKENHVGVRNLTLELSSYDHTGVAIVGRHRTGALAGWIQNTRVTGVEVLGTEKVKGGIYVGGLIGTVNSGVVTNSDVGVVVDGKSKVGGLVGSFGYGGGQILGSYATGEIMGVGDHVGGLVGYFRKGGEISHSYATGSITRGVSKVGGLVGSFEEGGEISHSYATGSITRGNRRLGGLVGYFQKGGEISHSYATGSVNGSDFSIGGLVGSFEEGGEISYSYATGSVTGGFGRAGGLVGYFQKGGEISHSYATGLVNGTSLVGGLVGAYWSQIPTLIESYWDKETTGQLYSISSFSWISGLSEGLPEWRRGGSTTIDMRSEATFTSWDFTSTWMIDPAKNDNYPYLRANPPR